MTSTSNPSTSTPSTFSNLSNVSNFDGVGLTLSGENSFKKEVRLPASVLPLYVPYSFGMEEGCGVNFLTEKLTLATAVDITEKDSKPGSEISFDGQTSHTKAKVVHSVEKLFSLLNISASASGSYGIYSANGSYSNFELSDVKTRSTFVLLTSTVLNEVNLGKAKIKRDALEAFNKDPADFVRKYGDYYVKGFLTGIHFRALITIQADSSNYQKRVAAKLSATINNVGSANANYEKEMKEYKEYAEINIEYMQMGGVGNSHGHLGQDLKQLAEKVNNFAHEATENPVRISAICASYLTAEGFPDDASFMDRQLQKKKIEEFHAMKLQMQTLRNELFDVLDNRYLYVDPPEGKEVRKWRRILKGEVQKIDSAIESWTRSEVGEDYVEPELLDEIVLPDLRDKKITEEEDQKLGKTWVGSEGNWSTVYRRIGKSRIFEGSWSWGERKATHLCKFYIDGNTFSGSRIDEDEGGYLYEGKYQSGKILGKSRGPKHTGKFEVRVFG